MTERGVPVGMGSQDAGTWLTESALVTLVSFPGRTVLERHTHDKPTFAVVFAGGFDVVFGSAASRQSRLSCPSGTILVQPADEPHLNRIGCSGAQGVVIQPNCAGQRLPASCMELFNGVRHFQDQEVVATARRLAREISDPDDVSPLYMEVLIFEMLLGAVRSCATTSARQMHPPPWLLLATEFIHEQFRARIGINDVAAVAGVHAAHLAQVFRRFHNRPLGSYVRRLRLNWAAERLIETEMPIAVIAAEAGFSDQAHLTRWFRRSHGWSPAAYRRAHSR